MGQVKSLSCISLAVNKYKIIVVYLFGYPKYYMQILGYFPLNINF